MIQITKIQLFMLIMLFEVGSTTLFALGIDAKQDAWLVVLLAFFIGTGLIWVFTQIPRICPDQNFSEILNAAVGRKLAIPLLIIYGAYFLDGASYNFYEFGALIKMTALPQTPLLVILYFFMLVSIYILSLGFEVLARTGEILLPVFIIFLITIYIFTMFSGQFDITGLLPILGNGIKPLLGKTLFDVVFFPFGELVVFIMFWHFVNKQEGIRKITFLAVTFSTFLIIFSLIIVLATLGPDLTGNTEIPLLQTILSINIADFFTNLDLLAVLIMFIGGFYKMSLHFYGGVLAIIWIFKIKNIRWVILVLGLIFPIYSNMRFENMAYHRWLGFTVHTKVMAMINLMSLLLLIVIYLKKKVMISKKRRKSDGNPSINQES
ncbi:spore gernimation protein GerK [Bacillus sp. AFS076308]|uniref:GerAB/ArcD/ProY family transporter n=1 Tax=unclassified Bacillus (in: firmicutes) TaxID=185979 RepID=UPI000BF3E865|nr:MULTISPECIES: GerAB/ArcD/ProY family transporter [unclassified Bacillus (in: firmicutes)]PFO07426.1 spore gernimation protein GerK [Bacillus sp. AFS076308]PGV52053.1 spore gernimation protein GerK [Bacillus sp. AFS037270]